MKRIVSLIDGTWNEEGKGNDTNIAKLDPNYDKAGAPLIKPKAADGTRQIALYHEGVGSDPDFLKHALGGAIGIGLRKIVQDAYRHVAENYAPGDEIYILGFSRGAYAARALAGLIGASGIQTSADPGKFDAIFDAMWSNFRDKKVAAENPAVSKPRIKCVGVFDTVGSYGVPAGIGLAALGRYFTMAFLGFHDTEIGEHIDIGLHAMAVDERRRPFVPTLWTAPKAKPPTNHVEQTWFAGVHCNIGGGYQDAGLSDQALIWMIARLQALTGLEFDVGRVKAVTKANPTGNIEDSAKGWWIDQTFPHGRVILSPDAIEHGSFFNTANSDETHVNEKVHWSVIERRNAASSLMFGQQAKYAPDNLSAMIPDDKIAAITPEEQALLARP